MIVSIRPGGNFLRISRAFLRTSHQDDGEIDPPGKRDPLPTLALVVWGS